MRFTVEQDVLFPNVPEKNLEAMQQEPMFQRSAASLHKADISSNCLSRAHRGCAML